MPRRSTCPPLDRCSCGSKLPIIDKVNGRTTDMIRLPDGGCIPGDFLTTVFDHAPDAVSRFQVIQHKDYSITIKYVPCSPKGEETAKQVCRHLHDVFHGLPISAEAAEQIVSDRGKTRFVVSELND